MATRILTREEADKIIKAEKVVSSSISWRSENPTSWRLEARALIRDTKEFVSIRGYIGSSNYSFVLLFNNIPIRKFTKHCRHQWNGQTFTQPHKHVWDETTEDREVYIPLDIDPKDDINNQFISFCNECNINIKGGYQHLYLETALR
mgnify:CR=1 FL=1